MTLLDPTPTMADPMPPGDASGSGDLAPQPTTPSPAPIAEASAGVEFESQPAKQKAAPDNVPLAGADLVTPPPARPAPMPTGLARVAEYDELNFPLLVLAESLHDIELTRMGMASRLHQLAQLDPRPPGYDRLQALHDGMAAVEHQAVLDLQRAMRKHPLYPWVKRSKGVGEKQAARLLAAIGNPYWNSLHGRPRRGPAELWAYCGYNVLPAGQVRTDAHGMPASGQPSATPTDRRTGDTQTGCVGGVAPKRRKGQRSNWNNAARMRAYLVAESIRHLRVGTPGYREEYERGRTKYVGIPDGHADNRALRLVAKAVLKDIYLEARAWHEGPRVDRALSTPQIAPETPSNADMDSPLTRSDA